MTEIWPYAIGAAGGVVLGAFIAGLASMERPRRWTLVCRIPAELHNSIRRAAHGRGWSVRTEIKQRLSRPLKDPHDNAQSNFSPLGRPEARLRKWGKS
jgi:hypothetical protein